jgi:hypothetical protein
VICTQLQPFPINYVANHQPFHAPLQAGDLQPAVVRLCPGTHTLTDTLDLTSGDSNIAWKSADPSNPAIVTAAMELGRSGWSKHGSPTADGTIIWSTPLLPASTSAVPLHGFRQLWKNADTVDGGRRRARATLKGSVCGTVEEYALGCQTFQTPTGGMNLTASLPGEFPGYTANTSWPADWQSSDDVEVVYSRSGTPWTEYRCKVNYTEAGSTGTKIVLEEPCWSILVARSGCRDQAGTCTGLVFEQDVALAECYWGSRCSCA